MNYFYTTGVDLCSDKSMFNFVNNHFKYFIMSSWNGLTSIANKVKVHTLNLDGNCWTALAHLESGGYNDINDMIYEFEMSHPGCKVFFNGRSSGYLVLCSTGTQYSIIPESLNYETYEDYKDAMKYYYGSVRANREVLRETVELIRDFDRFCDEIRDWVNDLSLLSYEITEMNTVVESFNEIYSNDLELLGFKNLEVNEAGEVDISEIYTLQCLAEAFQNLADRKQHGYRLAYNNSTKVKFERI